jgi:hypothetical protein
MTERILLKVSAIARIFNIAAAKAVLALAAGCSS